MFVIRIFHFKLFFSDRCIKMGYVLQDVGKSWFYLCYSRELVSWAIVSCFQYPDYTVSENSMTNYELGRIQKDLEGRCGGLILKKFRHFHKGTKENHENIHSLQPVLRPKLYPRTPRIRVSSVAIEPACSTSRHQKLCFSRGEAGKLEATEWDVWISFKLPKLE